MVQSDTESENDEGNIDERDDMTLQEISRKRRRISQGNEKYVDTNFVLGSVAIVERLWPHAKHVLSDTRKRSLPVLVEAILFLKTNRSYWNISEVCKAMSNVRES